MRQVLEPLRVRPFSRLLASFTVNELGDSVGLVALALLVYAKTGDALATTALYLALNVAPALLAPALTARLDRAPLRKALPVLYVVEAAVFLVLALTVDQFSLVIVLLLGAVDGTLAVTGRALTRAGVVAVLGAGEPLRRGNGLINAAWSAAAVGGAALGGLLVGTVGTQAALLLDSASFLLIAVLLAATRGLPSPAVEAYDSLWNRIGRGLSFVRRVPRLRLLLAGETVALVLFTTIVPIEVVYARETLGTDEQGFGLLLASWGAGMVLGSLAFLVVRRSLFILALASTALIGLAYLGMSAVDTLAAACAFSIVGGAGNGVQWVSVMTAVQEATPEEMQARVVGLLESAARLAPALGFVIGGTLTALTSPTTAFAVAGAATLLLVFLATGVAVARRRGPGPAVR